MGEFARFEQGLRMSSPVSLISELEDVILHGAPGRVAAILQSITTLFLEGADRFNQDHLDLFDDVLLRLIDGAETEARIGLSCRLAPISNAPMRVICRLAEDDDISVARPVLEQFRGLDEGTLIGIAERLSQAHLLALSNRKGSGGGPDAALSECLTDVLVRRGDRSVVRNLAQNSDALLSEQGISTLVYQAGYDDELAEKVGLRNDVPPGLFRELLSRASVGVQQRLLTLATPQQQTEIKTLLADEADETSRRSSRRDFTAARHVVETLARHGNFQGKPGEAKLMEFAADRQYEELVVALAHLCSVPVEVVDRLLCGDRADGVMILCKSAGCGWPTVKAILSVCPGAQPRSEPEGKEASNQRFDEAFSNFERLPLASAQRVIRFWQAREQSPAV